MDQQPLASVSSRDMQAILQRLDDERNRLWTELGESTHIALFLAHESLPDPPVSRAAPLSFAAAAASPHDDGVDRISLLPDELLKNVVSRLPAKDAARTAALASRWRGLWRSVPLVLVDEHLLDGDAAVRRVAAVADDDASRAVVAAASGALAAHPGPFRCVRLTWSHMASHQAEVARWLQLLAAKGVQELDFINRPWPLDLPLSAALFSLTSLTRLHIGIWRFPDTAALNHAAAFPHLRELFLTLVLMTDQDLAFLLERCPVLEVLTIVSSRTGVRLRLASHSLRCLQLVMSPLANIALVDAPRLERLFLTATMGCGIGGKRCARINIDNAPNLCMLGYWQPGQHQLQIGRADIKAGTKVSSSTNLPSIRILGLEVQFEVRNEVKTVPTFLKCFPNIETLHISSMKVDEPTGKVNLKFWLEAGPVECVQQHVKKLVFHGFQGKRSEVAFLKFVAENAQVLEKMVIVMCSGSFSVENDVNVKLRPLTSAKWACKGVQLMIILKSPVCEEEHPFPWRFRMASEFSCGDPFDLVTTKLSKCN